MLRHPISILWARLVCFACTTMLLLAIVLILGSIDGWLLFQTGQELLHEMGARLFLALGSGALLGTASTALVLPYVWANRDLMQARCERIAQLASSIAAIGVASTVLGVLLHWSEQVGLLNITQHASVILWIGLSGLFIAGYVLCPPIATHKARVQNEFIRTFSGPMTRRVLLIGTIAGMLTAFSDKATPRPTRKTRRSSRQPSQPNIILVTFDALCAEDMSCYGYHLDTTPSIAALAGNSHLFTNYYATSTFTTPNIISMMTGRYPSSTRVYHYGARLHGVDAVRTLPRELSEAGYHTAASVANPGAHPDCLGFGSDFDDLPAPPIKDVGIREAAAEFHSALLAYDAGLAGRVLPYTLEQISPRLFGQTRTDMPPALSFQQAEALLWNARQPHFLWVHAFAPHSPYLPDPPYLHKFLAGDAFRTHAEFANMVDLKGYAYTPARQPAVDKARLRYDEWLAQADGAFGAFIARLRAQGHLENTVIIVSADHGESFAGGFVGHGGTAQRRPILHVPLLIHFPGQTHGRVITEVTDQTALAPTVLELAGLAPPAWMDGASLCPLLRGEARITTPSTPPLAFAQVLERNSVFKPASRGTLGVIDGRNQYLYSIDQQTGALFDLAEADRQQRDRSAQEPALAALLHRRIMQRFPGLFGGHV